MAFDMVLRRAGVSETTHGFRSSFRDWCKDVAHFPRELAEEALAHKVGDDTERAYARSDALEKRRPLMEAWASYIEPPRKSRRSRPTGNVVDMARHRRHRTAS